MTQNTDQERAEFEAWYSRRYGARDFTKAIEYARRADAYEVWQAARRVRVVPTDTESLNIEVKEVIRSRITGEEYVLRSYNTAPVQDEEAKAPVQMPEPVAYLHECGKKPSLRTLEFSKVAIQLSAKGYKSIPLYTYHQVSQLLAKHGIK